MRIRNPDPALFVIDLQDAKKKLKFFILNQFFCLLPILFSKIKKFQKKSQNSRNQGFSYFLLDDRRIRIRIHTSD